VAVKNQPTLATLISRKQQSSKSKTIVKNDEVVEAFASTKHTARTATGAEHLAWHVVAVKQTGPYYHRCWVVYAQRLANIMH
jgi:predicted regulator of amino acid metabolism with ACT domain